ncbi:hypothetical protein [Thioclava sp. L04-15]|uniref:hypothetical protein n=1 Tax=Thioclava sp. L04-15 TaxID=1915318 RepID=UPI0011BA9FB0|nr:hypothetical protein [Thioclava sp. L04-15]
MGDRKEKGPPSFEEIMARANARRERFIGPPQPSKMRRDKPVIDPAEITSEYLLEQFPEANDD